MQNDGDTKENQIVTPCYNLLAQISTWLVVQSLAQLPHSMEATGSNP